MPDPTFESGGLDARTEASVWFARGIGLVSGGLVVVALAAGLVGAGRVLLLVFFAVLLASALGPLVDWLRTSLPIGRGVSILLVYVAFFVAVAAIGFVLVPVAVIQAGQMMDQVPAVLDRVEAWSTGLQPTALATSVDALVSAARAALSGLSPGTGQVVSAGLGLADVTISAVTVLALVFFWMTERQRLQRFTLSFLPPDRRGGVREAWNIVEVRLGAWVRGQLLLMLALGLMTGVAYSAMGLPSGPILGVIAGLAEVVPLVGPALGVLPALLIAAAFRPDLLIVVVVVYVVIQLAESNFLVPLVMRNAVGVSPFLLTVSLLIGAALGGILGALVAVPMVAAVEAVLERMQDRQVPVAQDAASATAIAMPSDENTIEPQPPTA
jgi:predicted PurR-regulated permease PerM